MQILPQYLPLRSQEFAINPGVSVDAVDRVAYIKFSNCIKSAPSYFGHHMEITGQLNAPGVLIPVPIEKNCGRA
jgi:ribonuclease I